MNNELAEFSLTGRVSKAPMSFIHGFGSNGRGLVQLDVSVTRYGREGKASVCPFTVEVWSDSAKQALNRLQPGVGDMVRITGKLTNFRNTSKKTGRVFENVRFYVSSIDRVDVAADLQGVPQQSPQQVAFERQQQQAACGRMGQRSGEVGQLQDEDIPF